MKSEGQSNIDEYNKYKKQPKEAKPVNKFINFGTFNRKIIGEINLARAQPSQKGTAPARYANHSACKGVA